MILIEKLTDNVFKVTDEKYSPDRYKIVNNFLKELCLMVLDYKIVLKDTSFSFMEQSMDVYPLDIDTPFEDVMKGLYENSLDYKDDIDENIVFDLTLICKKY